MPIKCAGVDSNPRPSCHELMLRPLCYLTMPIFGGPFQGGEEVKFFTAVFLSRLKPHSVCWHTTQRQTVGHVGALMGRGPISGRTPQASTGSRNTRCSKWKTRIFYLPIFAFFWNCAFIFFLFFGMLGGFYISCPVELDGWGKKQPKTTQHTKKKNKKKKGHNSRKRQK